MTYRIAQHVHPLPYRGGRMVAAASLALALGLVAQSWSGQGAAGEVMKIGAAALFVLLCWRLGLLRDAGGGAAPEQVAGAQDPMGPGGR